MKAPLGIVQAELTNREKARQAKRARGWCGSCDRQLVSLTEKCPVCGGRENRRKLKIRY